MTEEVRPEASRPVSRRGLLTGAAAVAGAVVTAPVLTACGSGRKSKGPGTVSASDAKKVLPNYIASKAVTADIPSSPGANGAASDPAFLNYPSNPAQTVSGTPGSGGSYGTRTPLWGAIPASSGNAYYDAVNRALGSTLKIQPSDGNNYVDNIPPLFASGNLPDWIQIPRWANGKLGLGNAMDRFADLTPYLSGSAVAKYPNLANIPSPAWQAGMWNGRIYGLPCFASSGQFPGYLFYRKDILDAAGLSGDVKSADDLMSLGKALNNPNKNQWAFDDLWPYLPFCFGLTSTPWTTDASGKLVYQYETDAVAQALDLMAKLSKAGYVHPDAMAYNTQQAQQRFWSGKVVIQGGGIGVWDGDDAKGGTAANPKYNRQAVKVFSANGTKPGMPLLAGADWYGYLNRKLSDAQLKECLAVANYLAAPYGTKEHLLVNFGAEGVDYTIQNGNPVLTDRGQKEVATTFQFLVSGPQVQLVKNGFTQVVKDYVAWQADAVKYAVKPLFFAMNVVEPPFAASLNQQVEDTMKDVRFGRKPLDAFKASVETWRKQGGDQLRKFYEDVRDKYGTGQ